MPKISILVPVYNVERYLRQCLDSLINQTLRDIEIICINDGSTDNSGKILAEYAKLDRRIFVITKSNSGYGDSMNQGLKRARGEYIGILEPDDWIEPEAYEKLYQLASWRSPEVVKANYYQENAGKTRKVTEITLASTGKLLDPRQDFAIFRFNPAIWSAIYQRKFLEKNDIKFLPTPGASYQDTGFSFKVWSCARKVVLTTDAFVHYRLDNQTSSVNSPGKLHCIVDEYQEIETFLTERGMFSELGSRMNAIKFRNYHWNLQRLSPALATKFYQTMRREFLASEEEGVLDPTYFTKSEWLALRMILRHPRLAYRILRLRSSIRHHL